MKKDFVQQLKGTVAIVSHDMPDGDAIGSCNAIYLALKELKIESQIIFKNKIPQKYDFLNIPYKLYNSDMEFDNLIILDTQELSLLKDVEPLIKKTKKIFVIDHHPKSSNTISKAEYYVFNDKSCTAQIIAEMFLGTISSVSFLESVYTAILYDTDGFSNSNVNEPLFSLCSKLCEKGLKPANIYKKIILQKSFNEIKLIGSTLTGIELFKKGKIVVAITTYKMFSDYGINPLFCPSIFNNIKGCLCAQIFVHIKELKKCEYKISLRSEKIDVRQIAKIFDGGGHKKAAGFKMKGSLEDVKKSSLDCIKGYLT